MINKLFYKLRCSLGTTVITTTTITKTRYTNVDEFDKVRKMYLEKSLLNSDTYQIQLVEDLGHSQIREKTIGVNGNTLVIGDAQFNIPRYAKSLPPLINSDGSVNDRFFPENHNVDMVIGVCIGDQYTVTLNGMPLTRRQSHKNWSRNKAIDCITKATEEIQSSDNTDSFKASTDNYTVSASITDQFNLITFVTPDGDFVHIYQDNHNHLNSQSGCINWAATYARVILLSLHLRGTDIRHLDEGTLFDILATGLLDKFS